MTIKVGINGFGRIGRLVLRVIEERKKNDHTTQHWCRTVLHPVTTAAEFCLLLLLLLELIFGNSEFQKTWYLPGSFQCKFQIFSSALTPH